jgi:hypothetical protein
MLSERRAIGLTISPKLENNKATLAIPKMTGISRVALCFGIEYKKAHNAPYFQV